MSYAVVAAEPAGGSQTSDADDAFLHHLKRPGVHLFTANWCGICLRMKDGFGPNWQDLTNPVPYIEHEVSTYESESLKKTIVFEVTGFPTIYFVKANGEGKFVTKRYEGERLKNSIDDAYGRWCDDDGGVFV